MSFERKELPRTMETIFKWARAYLEDEIGAVFIRQEAEIGGFDTLSLQQATVVADTRGPVNVMMAFSFDTELLERVYQVSTEGLDIATDERDLYLREAAAETVNCILGHATTDLANATNAVILSPPLVLSEKKNVDRPQKGVFATLKLLTSVGVLAIYFIIPSELFDKQLNLSGREHAAAEGSHR